MQCVLIWGNQSIHAICLLNAFCLFLCQVGTRMQFTYLYPSDLFQLKEEYSRTEFGASHQILLT
ncbi:hypothetical protein PAHAL_8G099200 [Panicum hallii]|uniref:Uncharacterized protein n=1 Tax=Panicum hallii TaxID=206008 RepID=A0A2S3IE94_9POAL|nr:hypothetical protein PAHAL_8G099200 [Panicum hallii]